MISDRKDDHVRHAVEQQRQRPPDNDFDQVRFLHHALAGIDADQVDLRVQVAGMTWPVPLYINAMTGGSHNTGQINRQLAIAARKTGLPIATGSMSACLRDPALAWTYRVLREENPDGIVIANINASTSPEQAHQAVDLLEADALQIHLNAAQEIVMPEGDRGSAHWPRQITRIADAYHGWRGTETSKGREYADVPGLCRAVTIGEIAEQGYVLTPGRYVVSEAVADDGEPLDVKIARLSAEIRDGFKKREEMQVTVLAALDALVVPDG